MNNNLLIWNAVEKTAPSATKRSDVGGGRIETSINGTYMFKRATEIFGPIGLGWGYEIVEERIDVSPNPIAWDADGRPTDYASTHTIRLELWFRMEDWPELGRVTSYGHTPYCYLAGRKEKYIKVDGEAPKKSLTDAIKKALSMLGFSADIFMGQFDDNEYVQQLANEEALEKADDKDAEKLRQLKEYTDWKDKNLQAMDRAVSMPELEGLYKAAIRKAQRRGDKAGIMEFEKTKDVAKNRIEGAANETA